MRVVLIFFRIFFFLQIVRDYFCLHISVETTFDDVLQTKNGGYSSGLSRWNVICEALIG